MPQCEPRGEGQEVTFQDASLIAVQNDNVALF